jgi:hypothetical protein
MEKIEMMTLEQAKAQEFEVVMLPPTATQLIEKVRELHESTGREAIEFEHEVAGFKLHCLGLKPREGVVAPVMKARKRENENSN